MPALLALAPAILQGLMMILKWFAEKSVNDKQKEEFFKQWKSLARTLNLVDLVEKYEQAEKQAQSGDFRWDHIEAEELAKKKGKK